MDLNTLYGVLRAQLLSRHFALSRHFRADYPSYYNNLGVVHQASVGKRVFYVDGARHVHALSAQPDGSWADTDLIAAMGAPPGDGTGLSGCQWADGSEQVFYLDASGDVHELATTADGQWADLNLTQRTGAPAAVANSALSAYQWAAANSLQVVYLDAAGHVHELSGTVGRRWAHTDLTQRAGAPAAGARSRLSGYEWADGKSKQVVYLDALSGYQWAGGNAKQVVYLDAAGNVSERSATWDDQATPPGPGPWAYANLTLLSHGPASAPGSPLPSNEWPDDTENALAHGCLWASGGAVLTRRCAPRARCSGRAHPGSARRSVRRR